MLQRCAKCGIPRFPPSHLCRACHDDAVQWFAASGAGTVHSFTVVRRAPSAAWRERVPYVIALVDLAEGIRLMGNIPSPGATGVSIGDAVEVVFEPRGDLAMPQFRLAGP